MTETSLPADEKLPPFFAFELGSTRFLCPADAVEAVTSFLDPIPLPRVPAHVLGLVTYDQRALVLLDLLRFLGLDPEEGGPRSRTIVVQGGEFRVGLPVHAALGVVQLSPETVRSGSHVFTGRLAEFVRAEAETPAGLAAVLDLEGLLEAARA